MGVLLMEGRGKRRRGREKKMGREEEGRDGGIGREGEGPEVYCQLS